MRSQPRSPRLSTPRPIADSPYCLFRHGTDSVAHDCAAADANPDTREVIRDVVGSPNTLNALGTVRLLGARQECQRERTGGRRS
jgi:hypothetical protein